MTRPRLVDMLTDHPNWTITFRFRKVQTTPAIEVLITDMGFISQPTFSFQVSRDLLDEFGPNGDDVLIRELRRFIQEGMKL